MGKEKSETVWVLGSDVSFVRVKHSGLYDLDTLLATAKGWMMDHKYILVEEEHSEAVKGGGKEVVIKWKPFRNVTDYIQFKIQFEVVVYREVDMLVEENGKKAKKQQGDMEVRMKVALAKNYRQTFRGSNKELLRKTYEKYLIRRQLEQYEGILQKEAEEFLDITKTVLGSFRR